MLQNERDIGPNDNVHQNPTFHVYRRSATSIGFVHDPFVNGRHFHILNIVDDGTKRCLGAFPDTSISDRRAARELTAIIARKGSRA